MKSFLTARIQREEAGVALETLVIYGADSSLDPSEFDEVLTEELEGDILPDHILVVLPHCEEAGIERQIEDDPRLETTLRRLHERVCVTFSTFGPDGSERSRLPHRGDASQLSYADFQRRVMTDIFSLRGGFLRSTEAFHFRNPSDRHTDRFMRLANALVRRSEISFFAFACLPYLPEDARVAYVDTPALFGLVGAINELRVAGGWVPVLPDCFGSYGGLAAYGPLRIAGAVVLISASSSGSLARALSDEGFPGERIVHVTHLSTTSSEPKVVCDLGFDARANPRGERPSVAQWRTGDCPLCKGGSVPITLSAEQFEIPTPLPTPLLVKQEDAPKGLEQLIARIVGSRAFRVGLGGIGGPKPMYVCANSLLDHAEYVERLDYAISRVVPASSGIIIKLDNSSGGFVDRIASRLGGSPRVVERRELHGLERDETISSVVVVSAVIESGRSLQDISRELRSSFPKAPQTYLVGFAKTESANRLRDLRNSLTKTAAVAPHEFVAIETAILPPDPGSSAWVSELDFLQRSRANGELADVPPEVAAWVEARANRLERTSDPLENDLFVQNSDDVAIALEHGFVFWPDGLPKEGKHTQADVFFTICSVLQNLRQGVGERVLRASIVQHTLLAPGNFGRFNDSIIQASFLRAALPSELNYAADRTCSIEMARIVRRILENADRSRGGAAAEMLLALAMQRLKLHPSDLAGVLGECERLPPRVAFLLRVCRKVLCLEVAPVADASPIRLAESSKTV